MFVSLAERAQKNPRDSNTEAFLLRKIIQKDFNACRNLPVSFPLLDIHATG
jgi:hypothetical protein